VLQGRLEEALALVQRSLVHSPKDHEALVVQAHIFALQGQFDAAEPILQGVLDADPGKMNALILRMGLRKMASRDRALVRRAMRAARQCVTPLDEASLRFAIAKYHDDVGSFSRAFVNYQRANRLLKSVAPRYDRPQRSRWIDDIIRGHSRTAVAAATAGASDSSRPVFIVGMMRSGTSLVEQILSSHPAVVGAGELSFWKEALHRHAAEVRRGPLSRPVRRSLGDAYLRELDQYSADARHVIDKAPLNSDRLGMIHSVFPRARFVYMRRDPIDTCLSCFFQHFSPSLNFTMDLEDLAHYHREHRRLMAHWCSVLPRGTLLEVPYAGLVADQERWTRRMLDFIGLEWDDACLRFHENRRSVITASSWQVRQTIYTRSVDRWRNYAKFIGPLLELDEAPPHGAEMERTRQKA
jgi:tetratricopeptide (TPR) repeat protein